MNHIIIFLIFPISAVYNINLALSLKKKHKIKNMQDKTDVKEPFYYDLLLAFSVLCLVISAILLISSFIFLFI